MQAWISPPLERLVCVDGQAIGKTGHCLFGPDAYKVAYRMGLYPGRYYDKGRWNLWPDDLALAEYYGAVRLTRNQYKLQKAA